MNKLFKRIVSALCAVCLLLMPVPTSAEEGAAVSAGSVSGYAGNTVTVNVTASGLEKLGAIELDVFYDPDVLSVTSATSSVSGATADVYTDEEGIITLALANPDENGISGSATLLTIKFKISSSAGAGTYPINIAIGDAYDSSLKPVSLSRKAGSVTVKAAGETMPSSYYSGYASPNRVYEGDETTITYSSYRLASLNLVSGVYEITYDETLFEFVEAGLKKGMDTADGTASINGDRPGYIKIVYISTEPVVNGEQFYIKLRAIKDTDAVATVKMKAGSLFAKDLSSINGYETSASVTLVKKYVEPEPEDYPDLKIILPETVVEGTEFEALVFLDGESSVAAADIAVSYNTEELSVVSVTAHSDVFAKGGSVTVNPTYSEGIVKFSFINVDGISEDQNLLVIKFAPAKTGIYTSEIGCLATGIRDADFNKVTLDFVSATVTAEEKSLESIEAETLPKKTDYIIHSKEIDVTGAKLALIYNDGSKETMDITSDMVSGFDSSKAGKNTITVSYEGKTATFEVNILNYLIGDVNLDGEVDEFDSQRLYEHLVGSRPLTDDAAYLTADVNQDGEVDEFDSQRLYEHLVGSRPLF